MDSVQISPPPYLRSSPLTHPQGIPAFPSFVLARRHALVHMAATFRYFARQGFAEGQSGHISVRDPEHPGLMWMNPLSRHFGLLAAGDMLCLDMATGAVVAGAANPATGRRTANRAGFFIHAAVHAARPDAHAVCHAHTAAGRAWAAVARPLDMLTQDVCNFYGAHAVYASYGGIVFGEDEGQRIAATLGPAHKAVILMNHGLLTVGRTVDEAGFRMSLQECPSPFWGSSGGQGRVFLRICAPSPFHTSQN